MDWVPFSDSAVCHEHSNGKIQYFVPADDPARREPIGRSLAKPVRESSFFRKVDFASKVLF